MTTSERRQTERLWNFRLAEAQQEMIENLSKPDTRVQFIRRVLGEAMAIRGYHNQVSGEKEVAKGTVN